MAKKTAAKTSEAASDDGLQFTFRLPPYLVDVWKRRMKSQPFKITNQAYLNKLVEDDLLAAECIAPDVLESAKDAAEEDE